MRKRSQRASSASASAWLRAHAAGDALCVNINGASDDDSGDDDFVGNPRLRGGGNAGFLNAIPRATAAFNSDELRLRLIDTPYDGNCALHAVEPAFRARYRRTFGVDALRAFVLNEWTQHASAYMDDIQFDARPGVASFEDWISEFRARGAYLPPKLVARAVENLCGIGVRLYAFDDASEEGVGANAEKAKDGPFLLYESDRAKYPTIQHQLGYLQKLKHVVRLHPLQQVATPPAAPNPAVTPTRLPGAAAVSPPGSVQRAAKPPAAAVPLVGSSSGSVANVFVIAAMQRAAAQRRNRASGGGVWDVPPLGGAAQQSQFGGASAITAIDKIDDFFSRHGYNALGRRAY